MTRFSFISFSIPTFRNTKFSQIYWTRNTIFSFIYHSISTFWFLWIIYRTHQSTFFIFSIIISIIAKFSRTFIQISISTCMFYTQFHIFWTILAIFSQLNFPIPTYCTTFFHIFWTIFTIFSLLNFTISTHTTLSRILRTSYTSFSWLNLPISTTHSHILRATLTCFTQIYHSVSTSRINPTILCIVFWTAIVWISWHINTTIHTIWDTISILIPIHG